MWKAIYRNKKKGKSKKQMWTMWKTIKMGREGGSTEERKSKNVMFKDML